MMNAVFYNCTDDPRKIGKNLVEIKSAGCKVYDTCSIVSPTLMLRYDSGLIDADYMYIPDWHRYYKIFNITADNGRIMYVSATVDVLETYKDEILACDATCIRNEGIGSPTYVPDPSFPLMPASDYVTSVIIGEYFPEKEYRNYILSTK